MILLSSSLTLVLRIFVPVFWAVLFGCLSFFSWVTEDGDLPISYPNAFRIAVSALWLVGLAIIGWKFIRLKRVEWDGNFLYVTDYFKTIRCHPADLQIKQTKGSLGRTHIHLWSDRPTVFGQNIHLLARPQQREKLVKILEEAHLHQPDSVEIDR